MAFLTEKQIEDYLKIESRILFMPEGGHEIVRANRLCWDIYDTIIELRDRTVEEIIDYTRQHMKMANLSFEEAFISIINYIKKIDY